MRARRSQPVRWVAVLAVTAAAGSVAVLAATAATAGTEKPAATITGKDLDHLKVWGTPGERVAIPTRLLRPAVDDMFDGLAVASGAPKNCEAGDPVTQPAQDLCDTKKAFDTFAADGRTVDLAEVTIETGGGQIGVAAVREAATGEVLRLADGNGITADEQFPAGSGVTLADALTSSLQEAGLAPVTVLVGDPPPVTSTSPAPPTTSKPTDPPATGRSTTPPPHAPGTTTSTRTSTGPTTRTSTEPTTTRTAPPPGGHPSEPSTPTRGVAPPPAGHDAGGGAPPADPSGRAEHDPLPLPLGPPSDPGLDVPGTALLPSEALLARLHQLVPNGDAVPGPGVTTTARHHTSGDRHTVQLRTAGSARATDAHAATAQSQLYAVLGALLGLTLVTVGLARAWAVRRSR